MSDPLDPLGDREEFFEGVAKEIEAFLLRLAENPDDLVRFINNRVAFLNESDLSDQAKALLLESDYSVIREVMRHRESEAVRWVCIWVI